MNTFMGGDPAKNLDQNWEDALRIWPEIVQHARDNGVKVTIENCPMIFSNDEWPARQQHRLVALHLAADHRAVGRDGGPQLRPLAPRLADDRPGPLHPRVRTDTSSTSRPRMSRSTATACTSAARCRPASAGRSRACPAWATPIGAKSSPTFIASDTTATASLSTRTAASRRPTSWSSAASCSRATSSAHTSPRRPERPMTTDTARRLAGPRSPPSSSTA